MKIFQWIKDGVQYVWKGVVRLFSPSDDDYPKSGIQPFEGDPYEDKEGYS